MLYFIECRTGCSCCWDENHYRGPYKTKEDAKKRIAHFKAPDSKYWPVASQYSKRGNYDIEEAETENIAGGRIIMNDRVYDADELVLKELNEDGSLDDERSDYFQKELY